MKKKRKRIETSANDEGIKVASSDFSFWKEGERNLKGADPEGKTPYLNKLHMLFGKRG